jgi:UDP-GlcNAc3NAcA epimerase
MGVTVRIVSIVGARPQFVKLAPMCRAVAAHNAKGEGTPVEHVIVHTGQHYDPELSDVFFEELEIPRADYNLGVGSGPHGRQVGRMLETFESLLLESRPDAVVVYGDTNSTIAGALVAAKLQIPVAHVEAGLRSFNRAMPEEINRIATDHVSDLLFAPTPTAMKWLEREGLGARSHFTGDIGYDAVLHFKGVAARKSRILDELDLRAGEFVVLTIHRSENASAAAIRAVVDGLLEQVEPRDDIVFPVHPRTMALLREQGETLPTAPRLKAIKPVGFLDMLNLVANAAFIATDSGGLQKEAYFLNTPCITLRSETEWVETVAAGANVLVGLDSQAIGAAVARIGRAYHEGGAKFSACIEPVFGDGYAAQRMLSATLHLLGTRRGDQGCFDQSGVETRGN